VLLPVLAAAMCAAEIPKGQLVEKVVCAADPDQSYAAYLPSNYDAARRWPILYCFDPGARGRLPVERFQPGAEKYGYIVVASNNSRNGPWEPTLAAINAISTDTAARFAFDDRRVYTAGFSGGARVATRIALAGAAAGVIACGGGFPGGYTPQPFPFAFFGIAGRDDFNYIELRRLNRDLETLGAVRRLKVFDGGHEWPPATVATEAIEWLELQAMRAGVRPRDEALIQSVYGARLSALDALPAAEAYLELRSIAADFKGLAATADVEKRAADLAGSREVRDWARRERDEEARQIEATDALFALTEQNALGELRVTIAEWRKKSEARADSPERRLARRVLQGAYIQGFEAVRDLLQRKDYRRAAPILELMAGIHPERAQTFYDLARSRASSGDRKKAIAALRQAAALGFAGLSGAAGDPAFASLRDEAAFRQIVESRR
jgi:dienelactone hydrolase